MSHSGQAIYPLIALLCKSEVSQVQDASQGGMLKVYSSPEVALRATRGDGEIELAQRIGLSTEDSRSDGAVSEWCRLWGPQGCPTIDDFPGCSFTMC